MSTNPSRKSPSTKRDMIRNAQCSRCELWYSALHPARSGDLCRLCLELSGENRSRLPGPIEHSAAIGRILRVGGRPVHR